MISKSVAWCAGHATIVVVLASLALIGGEIARRSLPRDVIPDLADPQICVVGDWMGHPAPEVANAVTDVLTRALDGIPGATVRGSSMSGMAYVTVVFGSLAAVANGRQAIVERIDRLRSVLPANLRIQVGRDVSSAGWVYQYALVDRTYTEDALSPATLRRLQETVLRPAIAAIPGVAEVALVGGTTPEVLVETRADHLRAQGLAFTDVLSAVKSFLGANHLASVAELAQVPVAGPNTDAKPARLIDLGRVRIAEDMRTGIADLDGTREAVGGIVLAERGADAVALVDGIERAISQVRSKLPARAEVVTVYDRTDLAGRVGSTMVRALAEEVAVVVLVLLIFLLHGRSAMIPMFTLAAVLALTFAAMAAFRLSATIMSLGGIGIALGLAVDADVVALEACHRRIEGRHALDGRSRRKALVAAAGTFAPAIVTSLVITMVAFLPVLAFAGETGRLLRPLALTKTFVIASTAAVALTLGPALRELLLRGNVKPEFDNRLTRNLTRLYGPLVRFALSRPALTLATAGLAFASCLPLLTRLGGEFLPRISEGDLLYMPTTLPGISAEQAAAQMRRQEIAIRAFPEVETVFAKIGRADTATDPAPLSMVEMTIRLSPPSRWPRIPRSRWYSGWASPAVRTLLGVAWPETSPETVSELVERLDQATRLPGWSNAWTGPVRGRMDMMSTGIRTPVGIRIVGADPERLSAIGAALRSMAMRVPGARGAQFESLGGEAWLQYEPDPTAEARYGVDPALVTSAAELLITGGQIGETWVDGKPLRVRISPDLSVRGIADQLRDATVRARAPAAAQAVPLGLLGRTTYVMHPSMVRSERGELVGYVYIDTTADTDPVGYVERAQVELEHAMKSGEVTLRAGERIEWIGQYSLFEAGGRRLWWIVPIMALSMTGLLILLFRSVVEAVIVLATVPFALVGSIWTLFVLGYSLSAPVWVGLFSAVGLAMQTGVVMVVYIDESFHRRVREGRVTSREDIVDAHAEGTIKRLRPKVMTVTTMGAGLLPLLWANGAGSEVLRRVAAPMLGGLATSAFLTLEILPVLYTLWRFRQLAVAQRMGVSMKDVVGTVPPWARQ